MSKHLQTLQRILPPHPIPFLVDNFFVPHHLITTQYIISAVLFTCLRAFLSATFPLFFSKEK